MGDRNIVTISRCAISWLMSRMKTPSDEMNQVAPRVSRTSGVAMTGNSRTVAGGAPLVTVNTSSSNARPIMSWNNPLITVTGADISRGNTIFLTRFGLPVIRWGARDRVSEMNPNMIIPVKSISAKSSG